MIILLFGPAGAGKTTIAWRLAGKLEESQVISSDQFRRKIYRRLMREVRRRKGEGRYLIVDGTFYRRRWREELREAVRGEPILEVYIHCSLETCLRRNQERGSPVPERAIHIIWKEFEPPEKPDLKINTDLTTPEAAAQRILESIRFMEESDGGSSQRDS